MFECCAGGVSPSAITFHFDPDCGFCVYVCVCPCECAYCTSVCSTWTLSCLCMYFTRMYDCVRV
jgi:hypothetical protein